MFDKGTLVFDLLQQMVFLEAINMKYDAIIAAYHTRTNSFKTLSLEME
jgi:hypothetical protein